MKSAILLAATALGCAIALASAPACPAPPSPDSAEAFKHFDRGVKLTEEDDWATALVEFEHAYALDPNYRVLFDIGQCRYQLHDYPGALHAFQRYLADGKDAVAPDRRSKVEADIEVLKGRIASLLVSTTVAGAEVLLDDAVVGTTPLSEPIAVGAGRHKITVRREGATAVSREVALAGEEAATITLDPVMATARPLPSLAPSPVPAASERGPAALPAWLFFGVAAADLGVGAYFGLVAIDDKSSLEGQCAGKVCPPTSQTLISNAQRDALVSTVCTSVGVAAAVGGVAYLAIANAGRKRPDRATAALLFGLGWLGASGSF